MNLCAPNKKQLKTRTLWYILFMVKDINSHSLYKPENKTSVLIPPHPYCQHSMAMNGWLRALLHLSFLKKKKKKKKFPSSSVQRKLAYNKLYIKCGGGLVSKSCPTLATPWTVACQAPLSMGSSRQEYWSGLPFPSTGHLSNPGIKPRSPALQADSLLTELRGKPT